MSGLVDLLRHVPHEGHHHVAKTEENVENIYSKVLKRNLPPENEIIFDEELKLLLIDGYAAYIRLFLYQE
jgi:hypothetical protein